MLKKFAHDLRTPPTNYQIAQNLSSTKLDNYYFLFREDRIAGGKDQKLLKKFDDEGIPLNATYIDVEDQDYVYFPITIGQMGLAVFHTWLDSNSDFDKNRFLNFPRWFETNAEESHKYGARWLTKVPLPQYRNQDPWQSAFSQARAVNILLRGYQITNNKDWADLAELALIPFSLPVSEGGVTSFTDFGAFYEEYTASIPTLVLNGMIFSLLGVYDYIRVFPQHKSAHDIFSRGIRTLKNILPSYDLGFWSRYNLCQAEWYPRIDPATILYHRLHIAQMKLLHRITDDNIFQYYAHKFHSQDNLSNAVKMYIHKYKALKKINRL